MSSDAVKSRLQLAIGGVATLGEELPAIGGQRAFAATLAQGGRPVIVTLHPAPPEGPFPGAIQAKLARFGELAHPGIVLPIASGEVEGRCWLIEGDDGLLTAGERLRERGPLPVREAVRAIRDVARALVASHRRGLVHGAIGLETVLLAPEGTLVSGVALSSDGHEGDDLDAFSALARALFYGRIAPGGALSRRLPPEVTSLLHLMGQDDPARRPQSAEAVLQLLDTFPAAHSSSLGAMLDSAGRGARSRPMQTTLGLLAMGGMIILALFWLSSRH